jgi:hypothetical protein
MFSLSAGIALGFNLVSGSVGMVTLNGVEMGMREERERERER